MVVVLFTVAGGGGPDDSGYELQDRGRAGMVHNPDKPTVMLEPYRMAIHRYLI